MATSTDNKHPELYEGPLSIAPAKYAGKLEGKVVRHTMANCQRH